MRIEQRIAALENQINARGTCVTCSGVHARSWAQAMRPAADNAQLCTCAACCGWLAELIAAKEGDS
jgi:hypothetical protein